jgi:hypothetical protein
MGAGVRWPPKLRPSRSEKLSAESTLTEGNIVRSMTVTVALAAALGLLAVRAFGQEPVRAPAPLEAGTAQPISKAQSVDATHSILSESVAPDRSESVIPASATLPADDNGKLAGKDKADDKDKAKDWRYRWYDGHWWYWTSQNHWAWYNDQGRWVDFNPSRSTARPYTAAYGAQGNAGASASNAAANGSFPRGPAYGPAGAPRPYPGAAPYGGVNAGAGRAGLSLFGGHGNVHFGRFGVGW